MKRSLAEFTTDNRFLVADFKENESDVRHGSIVEEFEKCSGKRINPLNIEKFHDSGNSMVNDGIEEGRR